MSRRAVLPPFALAARPSRLWLAWVLACLLGGGVAGLAYLPEQAWLLLPLSMASWLAVRANGWTRRDGARHVEVNAFGELSLDGQAARALDDCFVTPWLTVLNVRLEDGGRRSVMLWPDSAPQDARRQLRVYLKWFHGQQELSGDALPQKPQKSAE